MVRIIYFSKHPFKALRLTRAMKMQFASTFIELAYIFSWLLQMFPVICRISTFFLVHRTVHIFAHHILITLLIFKKSFLHMYICNLKTESSLEICVCK